MTLNDYIKGLPWGEKITLRYSINSKERTFGTYIVNPDYTIRAIDGERVITEFNKLRVKEAYAYQDRMIVMLAVGTVWLSEHKKWQKRNKMPPQKSLEELI